MLELMVFLKQLRVHIHPLRMKTFTPHFKSKEIIFNLDTIVLSTEKKKFQMKKRVKYTSILGVFMIHL